MSTVALALSLLHLALDNAKANNAGSEVIADLEAAIAKLIGVIGTDVTFGQLEGLRTKPKW